MLEEFSIEYSVNHESVVVNEKRSVEKQAGLYIVYCKMDYIQTINNLNKTAYIYTEYLVHTVSAQ